MTVPGDAPDAIQIRSEASPGASEPGVQALVATDAGGSVLGSVTTTLGTDAAAEGIGPGEGGFRELAVRPDARGRGVGAALVRRCLDDARDHRLDRLVTFAPPGATAAARLYEELGFRRLPWRDRHLPGGDVCLAFVRDLAPVVVRPAEPDELDRAGQLTLAGYVADGIVDPADGYAHHLTDAADRHATATLLVALDRERAVVGTVTFCRPGSPYAELSRPGEAEFRMLAVDPASRGAGVGAALVHACLDLAGAAGDYTLVLSTLAEMSAAGRLYRRLRFTADPARNWSPVPGIDLLAYRRPVRPEEVGSTISR